MPNAGRIGIHGATRRGFLRSLSLATTTSLFAKPSFAQTPTVSKSGAGSALDEKRMRELAAWTALTFATPNPIPFGAEVIHSQSGQSLMRAANAVGPELDPSAHAEVRTIRLACAKRNTTSLAGYTLYTTCEPCAMCMACALWANLDRVVFGATIADAHSFVRQIEIPATEIAKRSDMKCIVDGPVAHDACLALFTNPTMQDTFKKWNAQKP